MLASATAQRAIVFLLCCMALVSISTRLALAQDLQLLRDEVRSKDPEPDRPKRDRDRDHRHDSYDGHSDCDDVDDDCGLTEMAATVAGWVITMPYWGPVGWCDDCYNKTGSFPAYPYQYDLGYMMFNPEEAHGVPGPRTPFPYAIRARSDYGTDFSGLDWLGGSLVFETSPRLGIESDFRFYQEALHAANPPGLDSAWLGDANLFFRFAQSESLQMRSGLGINFLSDRQQTDVGFNFMYAGDYYPLKPWVISGEFDLGVLGDETLLHVRVTTGVQYHGLEAFVGYDLIDIGQFQSNSLVGGIRLWF